MATKGIDLTKCHNCRFRAVVDGKEVAGRIEKSKMSFLLTGDEWFGRVWLNPPYSRPLIEKFIEKMSEHGNGIALLYNRCDSRMFQEVIFKKATAMKFLKHRIRFYRPDGSRGGIPVAEAFLSPLVKIMPES